MKSELQLEHKREYMRNYSRKKDAADPELARKKSKERYLRCKQDPAWVAKYRERKRLWRLANPDKQKDIKLRYRMKHPEKVKAWDLKRKSHPLYLEKQRTWGRLNRIRNAEQIRKRKRGYYHRDMEQRVGRPRPDRCEVCNKKCRPCPDHNHLTGKYRGWICTSCNMALGLLKGDAGPSLILALKNYLEVSESAT